MGIGAAWGQCRAKGSKKKKKEQRQRELSAGRGGANVVGGGTPLLNGAEWGRGKGGNRSRRKKGELRKQDTEFSMREPCLYSSYRGRL